MNNFVCKRLETLCPHFKHIAPLGVKVAQTVVHFAQFQVQARKSGGAASLDAAAERAAAAAAGVSRAKGLRPAASAAVSSPHRPLA